MSLVHEALQKAEREKQRKTGVVPVTPPPATPVVTQPKMETWVRPATREKLPITPTRAPVLIPETPTPSSKNSPHGLLTVLIACVALVAMVAIVYLVIHATRPAKQVGEAPAKPAPSASGTSETTSARREPRPPAVTEPPAPVVTADDAKYKVTGIMKDPEGKYCAVLNGRVVYESNYIDGATVKSIERDRVTLDVAGHEAVARLY